MTWRVQAQSEVPSKTWAPVLAKDLAEAEVIAAELRETLSHLRGMTVTVEPATEDVAESAARDAARDADIGRAGAMPLHLVVPFDAQRTACGVDAAELAAAAHDSKMLRMSDRACSACLSALNPS